MRDRLFVGAVLAALAGIIVIGVVIVGFGRHNPSPPSLQDNPNAAIPGQVAYVDGDGCVIIAEASGASRREVVCRENIGQVTWIDAATLGYVSFSGGPVLVEVDIQTGVEHFTEQSVVVDGQDFTSPDGERAVLDSDGRVSIVATDGTISEIVRFDVPEHRSPFFITWSPDADWLLLAYDEGELWIVARDGSVVGTLATDSRWDASWFIEGVGVLPRAVISPSTSRHQR